MKKQQELMMTNAKILVNEGYIPPAKPACAYFVSAVMKKSGWNFTQGPVGWVPHLAELGNLTKNPKPGDLVIFCRTYDAVSPSGIGPEDDFTHIGILLEKKDGIWQFAHYSSSADRPVINLLTGYWQERVQEFRRLIFTTTDEETTINEAKDDKENISRLKIFYHNNSSLTLVLDNKNESVMELMLTARTLSGKEIAVFSHPYQLCPVLSINGHYHPIKCIGENGVEYMSR